MKKAMDLQKEMQETNKKPEEEIVISEKPAKSDVLE